MTDQPETRRPGPPSTLGEVHEALVAAATDRLYEVGVEIGLGSIRLSEAIEIVGVPRATAYRSLADDELSPQDRLRREVLAQVLGRDTRRSNLKATEEAIGAELKVQEENLKSTDVADRTRAFRAIIRVGTRVSFHGIGAASDRSILIAAMSAVTSQQDEIPQWQLDALVAGEHAAATQFADMYITLAGMFGYELRSGLTIEQFSIAVASLVEGLSLRYKISEELDDLPRATGADGAIELWTLHGISFEGLLQVFFEPNNPDDPVADLANH